MNDPVFYGDCRVTVNGVEVTPTSMCLRIRPGSVEMLAAVSLGRLEFSECQFFDLDSDEWARFTEHVVFSEEPGKL